MFSFAEFSKLAPLDYLRVNSRRVPPWKQHKAGIYFFELRTAEARHKAAGERSRIWEQTASPQGQGPARCLNP
jgi:hypothetical protein